MLLRIEDTDRARSTDAAIDAIKAGMAWMGLDHDGEVVSQFSRVERHQEAVQLLLDSGNAYYCYSSKEELQAMRDKAREEKRAPGYDGTWRHRSRSEAPAGIDPVVRIKSPKDGNTIVNDLVQGKVTFPNKDLDDFILLRSDGTPTYMLAVVVDDHDMEISHIIRGDDHLTNGARQTVLYEAFGWDVPEMAHLSLIHGQDGAKFSKRHGALGVEAYRDMGYLPEAMRNYLVRLGWSHGDDEFFSTDDLLEHFGLDAVGKSAARFDFKKLEAINGQHMRGSSDQHLFNACVELLPHLEGFEDAKKKLVIMQDAVLTAMPGLKERAKTLLELIDSMSFIFSERPLDFDQKASKLLNEDAKKLLGQIIPHFEAVDSWTPENTEQVVRSFAEENELKLGKVAQPLRAALTGRGTSPGIFDVLVALGKYEAIQRLKDQAA